MYPHAVMFHHFHSAEHVSGQGSISAEQFDQLIGHYGDRMIGAEEFMERALDETLGPEQVCLTFDDGLLCQYDVACPVMEAWNLTGFFFVYSGPSSGITQNLEVFRYFRSAFFKDFDEFFDAFHDVLERRIPSELKQERQKFEASGYLTDYKYYSWSDRFYRYLRDLVLDERHDAFMVDLMRERGADISEFRHKLWMSEDHIRDLAVKGHKIGLHSFSHPTVMAAQTKEFQASEYSQNSAHLEKLTGAAPDVMSHPSNSYNADTLDILKGLGVRFGFCDNLSRSPAPSVLEWPRESHTYVLRRLEL
jgi:peptidoglycan/xylan/chitin deacetylase (PgdA/CDA1 family)